MNLKLKDKSQEEIQTILSDAWLNIQVDEKKIYNPLMNMPEYIADDPHLYYTWLMMQPDYFSFLCSEIMNIQLLPTQAVMLKEMWQRKFPMLIASRGFGKSWILGLYAMLRMLLMPGRKVIIAGAAFRQSKVIFEYMETVWNNAPLLRDIMGTSGRNGPTHSVDMYRFRFNESVTSALPVGTGDKIRGQRAHDLIVDEFDALPREIFETVMAGFAAVSASPLSNVKRAAYIALAHELEIDIPELENNDVHKANQIIISGTAGYSFGHFGEYWRRWRDILRSHGNKQKLLNLFKNMDTGEDNDIPQDFNWKDYSIIRIPFELIPRGFMDEAMVARSKATMHSGTYEREFGAVFSNDSTGFFKRTLIERCVTDKINIDKNPSWCPAFDAALTGKKGNTYVYGVDTASERDNFSIVVLEVHPEHRRVKYVWTTNREQHKKEVKAGLIKEIDFYSYCAKKIRWLLNRFPSDKIAMDSQGGGIAIMEALHDPDKIPDNEVPIWEAIDKDKPKDTDYQAGRHIVEMINFASAEWTGNANHGMRKDFEDVSLLFPAYDALTLAYATSQVELDEKLGRVSYDTLEDCIMEIEELKNELATITITQTTAGRDKWDTPELKLATGKKGRLKKDRYSSLLMANMIGREMQRTPPPLTFESHGGFAEQNKGGFGDMYEGDAEFAAWANEVY